jgi:hypothetical protein
MSTAHIHWFLVVPRHNPDAPGHWHKKRVDPDKAAHYENGVWAYYEASFPPTHCIVVASRVPPHPDDNRISNG